METEVYQRWEHPDKNRYYEVRLRQDLFGSWVITKIWGGCGTSLGRLTNKPFNNYEEAVTVMLELIKRRKYKKYALVYNSTNG